MSYRPFRKIGQCLLTACVVGIGVSSLSAQSAPAAPANNPSRVDVFLGYSYFGAHGQVKPAGIRYSSVDEGAIGSGAYYFNKYVGGEVIGVSHPNGQNDQFFSISAGPIFRAPMQNFTLFAHGLVGGGKLGGPNTEGPAVVEHEPSTWGATLTAGGGMDYDLPFFNHKFGLRLFEADYRYVHADFGPSVAVPTQGQLGGRANLSAAELSTGLLMHFGHILPPPQLTYACAVTAPTGMIYPGDQVTVTGTATNLHPKKTATYSWTADQGLTVSSTSSVVTFTAGAPGTYTIKGHVTEGDKIYYNADCSQQVVVQPYGDIVLGCAANPSTVVVGDTSTITANGLQPQNRPITYSYSSTAGQIAPSSTSTTTLGTTGVAPGTIQVTCNAVDDKGQTATQMTTVTVTDKCSANPNDPACVKVISTKSLCTISFGKPTQPPARVDNEAKACLDEIALNAQRDPQAKLALTGNAGSSEKGGTHLAAERAVNTKDYLVKEKGVDASRISVYTGTTDGMTVGTTLIPTGATLDTTGLTAVDESAVTPQARKPLAPAKKHHKKK